jgi:hypothetical protein
VFGFKISDATKAEAQIQRLEKLLEGLAAEKPQLKGRVARVKVRDGNFLTLKLDGEMIPWDEVPYKEAEEKPGQLDPLIAKLKGLKMTVSIGVRDGYVLLALGESPAVLDKLGGPGLHLSDIPEFKPLQKHASARLVSVSYGSKALNSRIETTARTFDDLLRSVKQAIPPDALTEAQRQKLDRHLKELAKDIKGVMPEPGATLSFSFLTKTGYEGYAYNWGTHRYVDGSKPLTLLQHLGGSPILAAVGRSKTSPESYQMLVKWLKVGDEYLEEFSGKLPEEQKKEYEKWSKALRPLLKRLDEVLSKMLIPALADGQSGVVLDAKWTSKQWHAAQPGADKPLPMLELAFVCGVSDAALLEKGMTRLRSILDDFLAELRELGQGNIPQLKFPKAESRKTKAGTLYTWALPMEWGLDEKVAPTAGLAEKVAVVTFSAGHAERLLTATPLESECKLIQGAANRPLAGVICFNWPALVDAVGPWVEYAVPLIVQHNAAEGADEAALKKQSEEILKQARTVIAVLKCYRGSASISYFEDKALVAHSESIFRDLPEKSKP